VSGRRVVIEQNQHMKFMMIFALLDFYVDVTYPNMEGKSYSKKYKDLPSSGDFDLILRQLFRVAKLIRNALIHNPSSFSIANDYVNVAYSHNGRDYSITMSTEALRDFYTAVIMYLKGDMGKGNYFLGILRSICWNISAGIKNLSDEFGSVLDKPSSGVRIRPRVRLVLMKPPYGINNGLVHFVISEKKIQEWEGMDFYITHNETNFLVPMEALDADLSISEQDLVNNWKHEGSYLRA